MTRPTFKVGRMQGGTGPRIPDRVQDTADIQLSSRAATWYVK